MPRIRAPNPPPFFEACLGERGREAINREQTPNVYAGSGCRKCTQKVRTSSVRQLRTPKLNAEGVHHRCAQKVRAKRVRLMRTPKASARSVCGRCEPSVYAEVARKGRTPKVGAKTGRRKGTRRCTQKASSESVLEKCTQKAHAARFTRKACPFFSPDAPNCDFSVRAAKNGRVFRLNDRNYRQPPLLLKDAKSVPVFVRTMGTKTAVWLSE